jgi:formylglycine-generating enzyme required for sulfatase activity
MTCCPPGAPSADSPDPTKGPTAEPAPASASRANSGEIVRFEGGGSFIGTDRPALRFDGEAPRRAVRLKPFGLERHCVSNDRFAAFVAATGHVTEAERFGWSFVFQSFVDPTLGAPAPVETPWWRRIDGAFWRQPFGPGSTLADRGNHPVVHVSWNDARAFAAWCKGRLPTEAEWEHAARGGAEDRRFPWGDEEPDDTRIFANIWQGRFPHTDLATDGYHGTAPVDSFAANPAGLFNMAGNVWEWCSDPFRTRSLTRTGRERDRVAAAEKERVMKGGSYLCQVSYCYRYRIAARLGRAPDTSTGHVGFRVAYD